MKTYEGKSVPWDFPTIMVRQGDHERQLVRSMTKSPVGFEWGYPGTGPLETAHAILTDHFGGTVEAMRRADGLAQRFMERFVQRWARSGFVIDSANIEECLAILNRESVTPPAFCTLQETAAP